MTPRIIVVLLAAACTTAVLPASAQPLGTFRWQLAPFCNVVALGVTQLGSQFRFEGFDDQCGAATRAAVTGLGVPNADGTIEFGLTVVGANGPQHMDVTFSIATLGGPWRDGSGNTGTLVFLPTGPGTGGSPRPAPSAAGLADGTVTTAKLATNAVDSSRILDGSVAGADVNATEVQRRVTGVCAAGQFLQAIAANGTVTCSDDIAGAGTITGVTAGAGLSGGGASGVVSLAVDPAVVQSRVTGTCGAGQYVQTVLANGTVTCGADATVGLAGTGVATTAARSDHTHAISSSNTAIGSLALANGSASFNNVAVGSAALETATTGNNNVSVGVQSLTDLTIGNLNVAIGARALRSLTTSQLNVAVGANALFNIVSGTANTAVGPNALIAAFGSRNLALGRNAGDSLVNGDNNIYLMNGGQATESSTIRIGTQGVAPGQQNRAFIAGVHGATTGVADALAVVIDSNGQLGTVSSSRRYKQDIVDLGDISLKLQRLRPVQFRYVTPTSSGTRPLQFGLIAEEVNEVLPETVARNADGEIESVQYHVLPALLVGEVQRLERERVDQARQLAAQQQEIGELRARLAALEALLPRTRQR